LFYIPGQYVSGGVLYGMKRFPDVQDNTLSESLDMKEKDGGKFFSYISGVNDSNSWRYDVI
jgi:hypothetical protein